MEPDLGPVGEVAPAAPLPADAPEVFSSEREAARAMSAARRALENPAESATAATADPPELAEANNPPETDPVETETEAAEPEEALPAIERPRSWAKDLDEEWSSYPREAQERIAKREQERDTAIRRSQNEAAEARKAATAEREQAEQARKNYEAQLPALMQELQNAQQNTFADIRTVDDVTKLASEDPFRYLQWQAHQTKLQAVKAEADRAYSQKVSAAQAEWKEYVQKQNELATEYIPELADKTKGQALINRVGERLADLGFGPDELARLSEGEKITLYDYRIQRLLADSLKLQDLQSAKAVAAPKNLPPVTRPGTAPSKTTSSASKIQALQKEVDNSTGLQAIRASAALLRARRGG